MTAEPLIRRASRDTDFDAIWPIFHAVVEAGDTYAYAPETTREQARALWMAPGQRTFCASVGERVVGTYVLKPNQPSLGAHVANAAYMVDPAFQRRGIGRAMCAHSLDQARRDGFSAMQFNLVVSTNVHAVRLWQRCGFEVVGTLPKAFRHRSLGFVDAYVMHRFL